MSRDKLLTARLIKWLPHIGGRNEALPDGIEGATIVRIGTPKDASLVEGGGLVIDYRPAGSAAVRRAVLAFDETAMWSAAYFPQVQDSE
jgi:hypothetical protein